jgi:hypothetical protein
MSEQRSRSATADGDGHAQKNYGDGHAQKN